MPVKTFQARSDNPSNDKYPHQLMLALHLFGYVICCSFDVCQQENCFE